MLWMSSGVFRRVTGTTSCVRMKFVRAPTDLWPRYSRFTNEPKRNSFSVGYLETWNRPASWPTLAETITTCLLNWPSSRSGQSSFPAETLVISGADFVMLYALPDVQPTVSKHWVWKEHSLVNSRWLTYVQIITSFNCISVDFKYSNLVQTPSHIIAVSTDEVLRTFTDLPDVSISQLVTLNNLILCM